MSYIYQNPTRVVFGAGAIAGLAGQLGELGGTRALIVTDRGVVGAGILAAVTDVLDAAGLPFHLFAEVSPDPSTGMIEALRDTALSERTDMLQGALLAGMAFHNSSLGLCHAIAAPLGAHFHIPHGLANAVMLPCVMAFNLPACPGRLVEVAQALGVEVQGADVFAKAQCAVDAVRRLLEVCGVPARLREVGATGDKLDEVARDALLSIQLAYNPRMASQAQIRQVLEQAF